MVILTEKNQRKVLDVIGQLEDEVEQNPLDYRKWSQLIEQVLIKDKEEQVRSTFEKYLSIFTFDAKQWNSYVNFEINRGEFNRVELLFAKCLPITNEVELCRSYVSYVRRVNDVITGGEKARSTVLLAFDFATNKVGIDMDSAELWKDYLDFFRSWTPSSSWEQQQKNDLIRRLYKRCLVIPTAKIESMWTEYTRWENDVSNPNTASKFIAELSTSYMEARSWITEWKNATKSALRRRTIPLTLADDDDGALSAQVDLWFRVLELEKKNHLNLKEHDLHKRIEYAYKQATYAIPFVPEMWFRYHRWLLTVNEEANRGKCVEVLSDGLKFNPRSFLVAFQLSELYEKDGILARASEVLNNLITRLSQEHDRVQEELDSITTGLIDRHKKLVNNGQNDNNNNNSNDNDNNSGDEKDSDKDEGETDTVTSMNLSESETIKILAYETRLQELSKAVTLAYIKLMALSKRTQGIKEVRSVFKQRKNFKSLGYEFYVENALIEYYSDNKKIADKVFDLAMKLFSKNGSFLYAYLNYLILTNSVETIKVFFETALNSLQQEISDDTEALQLSKGNILDQKKRAERLKRNQVSMKKIIKKYIRFSSKYLDLDIVLSLEKRYQQLFPDDDDLMLFLDRYKADGLDAIGKYDLHNTGGGNSDDDDNDDEDDGDDNNFDELGAKKTKSRSRKRRKLDADTENYSPEEATSTTGNRQSQIPGSGSLQQEDQFGFVKNTIYSLLQVLPNAGYFGPPSEHVFNSLKLVELFSNLPDLPSDL